MKNIYRLFLLLMFMTSGLFGAVPGTPDLTTDTGIVDDNVTKINAPAFTGARDINDTITLYIGGVEVGSDNSKDSNAWTIDSNTTIDDGVDIEVVANGNDGNSTALKFTLDTTKPSVSSIPKSPEKYLPLLSKNWLLSRPTYPRNIEGVSIRISLSLSNDILVSSINLPTLFFRSLPS